MCGGIFVVRCYNIEVTMYDENRITYFAETDSRNKRVKFGIKAKDRTRHVYVIGKTGMGKSTLLENMAIQDLRNDEGMAFIDPHGKTADLLLEYVPEHRKKDVLYFAPFDTENPVSFNVMEDVGPEKRHLVVSGLMSAFKKLFGEESFSDRMQYILQNTILALLEYPDATMLGINRMLTDKAYRKKVVANVTDTSVKAYWEQEFANYTDRFAAEATPAIQNKIGQFTSNPLIRNIIGQPKSSFNIREMMDQRKIIIINLSKGLVGEQNANIIGSMIITKVYLAAMSRADVATSVIETLPNFYLYVDEFQSFANESFANILSEARKYKLNLTIAHQYIEQMSEEVRAAVFGNVGTMIAFRVGALDAEVLEREFAPEFTAEDLVNLGFAQIYLKLMIDGIGSHPFSAVTIPPIINEEGSHKEEIIELSRKSFAFPKAEVEKVIQEWSNEGNTGNQKGKHGDKPKTVRESLNSKKSGGNSSDRNQSQKKAFSKKTETHQPFAGLASAAAVANVDKSQEKTKSDNTDTPQVAIDSKIFQAKGGDFEKIARSFHDIQKSNDNSHKNGRGSDKNIPKKNTKKPSEENVNQLKNALAGILSDVKKTESQTNDSVKEIKEDISDIRKNQDQMNKNNNSDRDKNIEAKRQKTETAPQKQSDTYKVDDEALGQNRDTTRTEEVIRKTVHQTVNEQPKVEVKKEPKQQEVPEDVLRKILDVPNEK